MHSVQERAKDPESFGRKASKPAKDDPSKPMYPHPLVQITDLAAVRIIAYFPRTLEEIDATISQEFQVVEKFDKAENLIESEIFGYQSIHYLVKISDARCALSEYSRYRGKLIEVQARTILQHAWAEIEHDIQYKSSATIPRDIKRRFMALAGLLELADREFQAIQDADRDLTQQVASKITRGELEDIEITSASLRSYLDRKLGSDGRVSDFSFDCTARTLMRIGFTSLQQINLCIGDYNDDQLSRIIDGNRQGQLTRFECMILAGMGANFLERHPWANEPWFAPPPPRDSKHTLRSRHCRR